MNRDDFDKAPMAVVRVAKKMCKKAHKQGYACIEDDEGYIVWRKSPAMCSNCKHCIGIINTLERIYSNQYK